MSKGMKRFWSTIAIATVLIGVGSANVRAQQPQQVPAWQNFAKAQAYCQQNNQRVVFMNRRTNVYHYEGSQFFGDIRLRTGVYMCEGDAIAGGGHASKTGQ